VKLDYIKNIWRASCNKIFILYIKQLGNVCPRCTTIVYECDESFVDQTGGAAVNITVKNDKLIVIDKG